VQTKKDGKMLQRLIRSIESALAAGNATVKVEMEKRIPDKVTGQPREHDVVLTTTNNHHETIIALECRDRSRPVGVNAVEEFRTKCQDTGIHLGIIVSSKGFCKTAIAKAARYDIRCLSLEEAERFDWCDPVGITLHYRTIQHVQFNVLFPNGPEISRDTLQTEDGTPVNGELINKWGVNALDQYRPLPEDLGEHRVSMREFNPNVFGIRDGERVRANAVQITLTYVVSERLSPFSFRKYRDVGKSKEVTQAAISEVQINEEETVDLVLSTNAEGEITVAFVRSPSPESKRARGKKKANTT
jgi:restriction endonuclease